MSAREVPPHLKPVRFSKLKLIGRTPAHYIGQFEEEREDNASLRFGRLVHSVVLGGAFVVYQGERHGKKWAAFEAEHAGKDIVTAREHERAKRAAESVAKELGRLRDDHPDLPDLLAGEREKELAWMTEDRACGARIDVLGSNFVTELKTTTSAEVGWFTRNGGRLAYHAQLDWYLNGARMCYPREFDRAFIVAVEVKHPFVVTVFEADQETLDLGGRLWRSWWERLRVCETSNMWPGYAQSVMPFHIQQDAQIDFGDEL
jgi:hypothetical protein